MRAYVTVAHVFCSGRECNLCARARVRIYTCCVFVHIRASCLCADTICSHMYTHIHAYAYTYMHVCVHMLITHICMYVHTHLHILWVQQYVVHQHTVLAPLKKKKKYTNLIIIAAWANGHSSKGFAVQLSHQPLFSRDTRSDGIVGWRHASWNDHRLQKLIVKNMWHACSVVRVCDGYYAWMCPFP